MLPHAFWREVVDAELPFAAPGESLVRADELLPLPAPVRRYFEFMRVVGQPRAWSFRCEWTGRFRLRPDGAWKRCEAWQYNSALDVARICRLHIHYAPMLPIIAHDTYARGHGRMRARLFDLFDVEDDSGDELDTGELVTFVNDAVLLAPSMLLGARTRFGAVDERSFDLAFTDRRRTVRARVFVDERGAPVDFHTTDRFVQDPGDPEHRWRRAEWTTPIAGWDLDGARPLPTAGRAIWHLPSGPFSYVELSLMRDTLALNVPPGE